MGAGIENRSKGAETSTAQERHFGNYRRKLGGHVRRNLESTRIRKRKVDDRSKKA